MDATAGDPRADACRSYLLYLQAARELAEPYLELYCAKSGWNREELLAWLPVIAGARLAEHLPQEMIVQLARLVDTALFNNSITQEDESRMRKG